VALEGDIHHYTHCKASDDDEIETCAKWKAIACGNDIETEHLEDNTCVLAIRSLAGLYRTQNTASRSSIEAYR